MADEEHQITPACMLLAFICPADTQAIATQHPRSEVQGTSQSIISAVPKCWALLS